MWTTKGLLAGLIKGLLSLVLLAGALLAAYFRLPSAYAHTNNSLAFSNLSMQDGKIIYVLQIDMYDIRLAATPNDPNVDSVTQAALDSFTNNAQPQVEAYLLPRIHLYADDLLLKGKLTQLKSVQVPSDPQPFAEAVLEYPISAPPHQLALDYQVIFESDQWHVNYVNFSVGNLKKEGVIVSDVRQLEAGALSSSYQVEQSFIRGMERPFLYVEMLLLMVVLLLGVRPMRMRLTLSLLGLFVLGFTASFLLSGFNVTMLPEAFSRSLAGFSVIAVALYALFSKKDKQPVWLGGVSGFIIGFGLELPLVGMRPDSPFQAVSVVSYNAGVLAAVLILGMVFYVIFRFLFKANLVKRWVAAAIIGIELLWMLVRPYL